MQMSLLTLPVSAHAGNEQVVTSLCVYGTANWNYFYALKGFQALLPSPSTATTWQLGFWGLFRPPPPQCQLSSENHREEPGTVALDVTPVSKFDCSFVTLCTIRYVVPLISTLHRVSVHGCCSLGHELHQPP